MRIKQFLSGDFKKFIIFFIIVFIIGLIACLLIGNIKFKDLNKKNKGKIGAAQTI